MTRSTRHPGRCRRTDREAVEEEVMAVEEEVMAPEEVGERKSWLPDIHIRYSMRNQSICNLNTLPYTRFRRRM